VKLGVENFAYTNSSAPWVSNVGGALNAAFDALANKANKGRSVTTYNIADITTSIVYTASGYYWKNDTGDVEIAVSTIRTNTPFTKTPQTIMTMPTGFRPLASTRTYPCALFYTGGDMEIGFVRIFTTTGAVDVWQSAVSTRTDLTGITFSVRYIAV
jgi:hypothetical protein